MFYSDSSKVWDFLPQTTRWSLNCFIKLKVRKVTKPFGTFGYTKSRTTFQELLSTNKNPAKPEFIFNYQKCFSDVFVFEWIIIYAEIVTLTVAHPTDIISGLM